MCISAHKLFLSCLSIYPFIFTSQCQKKRAKSREGMYVLPFLCFKTLHVRAPNPLDTNLISRTQKLFISAQNLPPRGMSTSHGAVLCKDLCAVFEQADASAQHWTARSLPGGVMSSVHYLVQTCPVFAVLFSFGSCLSVQTPPPTYTNLQNKRYQIDSKPEPKSKVHLPFGKSQFKSGICVWLSLLSLWPKQNLGLDTCRRHKHFDLNLHLNNFYDW